VAWAGKAYLRGAQHGCLFFATLREEVCERAQSCVLNAAQDLRKRRARNGAQTEAWPLTSRTCVSVTDYDLT
jgi:hypothetical protein